MAYFTIHVHHQGLQISHSKSRTYGIGHTKICHSCAFQNQHVFEESLMSQQSTIVRWRMKMLAG